MPYEIIAHLDYPNIEAMYEIVGKILDSLSIVASDVDTKTTKENFLSKVNVSLRRKNLPLIEMSHLEFVLKDLKEDSEFPSSDN